MAQAMSITDLTISAARGLAHGLGELYASPRWICSP